MSNITNLEYESIAGVQSWLKKQGVQFLVSVPRISLYGDTNCQEH